MLVGSPGGALNHILNPEFPHSDRNPAPAFRWVVDEPKGAPRPLGPGEVPPADAYMSWTSDTKSSAMRAMREKHGPDYQYTKTMTPEEEAAYVLHKCDASLAPQGGVSTGQVTQRYLYCIMGPDLVHVRPR